MKTWAIQDGDLELRAGQYVFAQGPQKLKQDLSVALQEEFGLDRFHPRWGSLLPSYIGTPITPSTPATLQGEVTRVVNNYMTLQRAQIARSVNQGQKPPFGDGEVLRSLTSVNITIDADKATIAISLLALSGEAVALNANLSLLTGTVEVL